MKTFDAHLNIIYKYINVLNACLLPVKTLKQKWIIDPTYCYLLHDVYKKTVTVCVHVCVNIDDRGVRRILAHVCIYVFVCMLACTYA